MIYEECCYNCKHCSPKCADNADVDIKEAKCYDFELRDELAKIENGTLIELPCKAGDTVWVVYQDYETFEECIKESIAIEFIVMVGYIGIHVTEVYGRYQEVYVTREQAERRLAELKGRK